VKFFVIVSRASLADSFGDCLQLSYSALGCIHIDMDMPPGIRVWVIVDMDMPHIPMAAVHINMSTVLV